MKLYSRSLGLFGARVEIAVHKKRSDFERAMVPFEMKTLCDPEVPGSRFAVAGFHDETGRYPISIGRKLPGFLDRVST